ncbi:uncharacterized protein METZ01_LOCUS332343 [marine metagenome]|uniref:Uncharacterized protein n=1 Tax=marine metagenome TaxID=408172 RepID=A0A382Q1R2_9ZZZZ
MVSGVQYRSTQSIPGSAQGQIPGCTEGDMESLAP